LNCGLRVLSLVIFSNTKGVLNKKIGEVGVAFILELVVGVVFVVVLFGRRQLQAVVMQSTAGVAQCR